MSDKYFIMDTNALISAALIKNSVNAKAFDKAVFLGKLVFSDETFDEFIEVLFRKKFDRYFLENERYDFIQTVQQNTVFKEPSVQVRVCRDESDDKFLSIALNIKADCLVTGDPDLLVLHPFQDIPILNAADFLQQF